MCVLALCMCLCYMCVCVVCDVWYMYVGVWGVCLCCMYVVCVLTLCMCFLGVCVRERPADFNYGCLHEHGWGLFSGSWALTSGYTTQKMTPLPTI